MVRKTRKTKKSNKTNKRVKTKHNQKCFFDGLVGILALIIYNFLLYLLSEVIGIKGIIRELQNTMGTFMLNTFFYLGFTSFEISIGIILIFLISFCLGIFISNIVRKRK